MDYFKKKYKTILLILVIISLACLISNNSILESIKNIYKKIFKNTEEFECSDKTLSTNLKDVNPGKKNTPDFFYESQKDFGYHSENLRTSEAEELYTFLQSMVTPNHNQYDLTSSSTIKHKSNEEGETILLRFLNQRFQSKIKNIKLIDKIFYFKNQVCLDLQPFQITGDYVIGDKNYGKVKVQIELTYRFDQPNDIFMSQTVFNNYSGVFKFNRLTLIHHKTKEEENKTKKNLPVSIEKPLTYSKYNFSYDNNNDNVALDTINSLIPEDISLTEYEEDSNSTQKIAIQ